MKQEIRFCTAKDGVRIAYALAGSGPPLVKTANWLNHLEFDWESPIWRAVLEPLARRHRLLRYDARGNGLSDWDVPEFSVEVFVEDLETVVDAAGFERFSLFGISQGCAVSIAYAVRHPDRVERMVLFGGYAKGWSARDRPEEVEQREAMASLMEKGWGKDNPAFRQMFTSLFIPDATPEQMKWFNDMQRISASPQNAARLSRALGKIDVLELLPRVRTPTLVLHSRGDATVPFEAGRLLATGIPDARFVPLDSQNHLLLGQDPVWEKAMGEIFAFLGSSPRQLTDEDRTSAGDSSESLPSAAPGTSWSEADRLFDRALDVPASRRAAWLREACGSNRELQRRVERLLAASVVEDRLNTGAGMMGSLWDEVAAELRGDVGLAEGARLGAYTIGSPLGRGGMGTVYRARHQKLEREVAVKALSRLFAGDPSSLRRFEREARLLASLNHPNIATVHDLLIVEGRPFLVMELVEGPTLAERLEEGPLGWREALGIAIQLAEALEEAHRHGIVHRDLKPANVKVTAQGRVKVLDFGLAKSFDASPDAVEPSGERTTRTGVLLGTPGYMSPEQARMEAVDARADNWAFGCILYEMLAGERAFGGGTISEAIASVLRDEVDWKSLPDLPVELVDLLKRCLDKDPNVRIQDMREVRERLAALEGAARPGRGATKAWLWISLGLALAAILAWILAGAL
jgi:pimeloyl-ACP methyl ester carboxylesterase/predicted Ser/Thr protein kinase